MYKISVLAISVLLVAWLPSAYCADADGTVLFRKPLPNQAELVCIKGPRISGDLIHHLMSEKVAGRVKEVSAVYVQVCGDGRSVTLGSWLEIDSWHPGPKVLPEGKVPGHVEVNDELAIMDMALRRMTWTETKGLLRTHDAQVVLIYRHNGHLSAIRVSLWGGVQRATLTHWHGFPNAAQNDPQSARIAETDGRWVIYITSFETQTTLEQIDSEQWEFRPVKYRIEK